MKEPYNEVTILMFSSKSGKGHHVQYSQQKGKLQPLWIRGTSTSNPRTHICGSVDKELDVCSQPHATSGMHSDAQKALVYTYVRACVLAFALIDHTQNVCNLI